MNVRGITALCIAMFWPHLALAQDALRVCEALADYRLVDVKIDSEARALASDEFDLYCSDKQNLISNLSSKSRSFTGSLAYSGLKLGLGSGSSSANILTQENIERICDVGQSSFVENYTSSLQESRGSALAEIVSKCVGNVISGDADYIWGDIDLLDDGRSILASIKRKAGNTAPVLKFAGMNPPSRFSNCRVGVEDALNKPLVKTLSISCDVNLSANESDGAQSVQGSILFKASNNDQPLVAFKAIRGDVVSEFKEGLLSELNAKIAAIEDTLTRKADTEFVTGSINGLATEMHSKLRPTPEQYTIYSDVEDPGKYNWSDGPGHSAIGKRIMAADAGFCALSQLGTESAAPVKTQATVDVRDGYWVVTAYTGSTSPRNWFVGAVCWRYR